MKRLYEVVPTPEGSDRLFYEVKEQAKSIRDILHKQNMPNAHVTLGPDHRDYGVKLFPTTHHNRMVKKGKKK